MKNLKSFPFERNRYFYGKLLSVEDFETEQKYFNDKRRTINRFLFGSGVVCGLHVLEVDDESISLERGLALDFAGREILVEEPVVKKIVDLEGYEDQQETQGDGSFYYLCLDYQERAVERIHNIAGDRGEGEYNKYREGYRLYLTSAQPEQEALSPARFYEETITVYEENNIKISQTLPRYLEMGSETALRVEIENTGQQRFSFSYELTLAFLTHKDETNVRVQFEEKELPGEKKYTLEIPLKAVYLDQVEAEAVLNPETFSLKIGEREYQMAKGSVSRAKISRKDGSRKLLEEYYKSAMDDVLDNTCRQSIYLAKIYVVKTADLCLIQGITQLPFGQCILHTELVSALFTGFSEEIKKLKAQVFSREKQGTGQEQRLGAPKTACGEVLFEVKGAKAGEILYSDRISHGLGLSPVTIVLGYEVEQGFSGDLETMFGDASVFPVGKEGFRASLGAKLLVSEGAFVIGMRVQKNGKAEKVRVRWSAARNPKAREEIQKKQLFIQPDIPNLHVGETLTFTTISEGFLDERIKWAVKDEGGGTIDKNGTYTAPETPGVFRISAVSTAYPQIDASTFVVVREPEQDWLG